MTPRAAGAYGRPVAEERGITVGKIATFVDGLAEHPEKERLFEIDPVAAMDKAGIEEEDQLTILDGTAHDIRELLREDLEDETALAFIIIMAPH